MTDDKFIKALTEFVGQWVSSGERISIGNMYGAFEPTVAIYVNNLQAQSKEDGQCVLVRPDKDK